MIEIGLGLLAILAAAGIAFGLTDGVVPVPLGSGAIVAAGLIGLALILRGRFRLALKRSETANRPGLRSAALATTISGLAAVAALTLPALSETLNLVKIGGFPLGTYFLGQGILIVFVALLFLHARRQRQIDDAGEP